MHKTKWNFSNLDKFIEKDDKNYDEQLLKKQKLFFYESINSYYQTIKACENLIREKNNTNISSKDFYFDYYQKFYRSKDFLQSYAEALFDEPTEFKMYSKKVEKYYSSIEDE